jgi:hypothetical protein
VEKLLWNARRFQEPFGVLGAEDKEIIADFHVLFEQAFPEAIQLEFASGIPAGVAKELGGHAIGDGALDGVGVQQTGQGRGGEESISHRLGRPLGQCRRPEPNELVGTHRSGNFVILDQGVNHQIAE